MSVANIPQNSKHSGASLQDVLSSHLASIAYMGSGLSKLIDFEADAISFIADCSPHCQDIEDINKSVNQVMKSIIKLQMLLQFKFESICRFWSVPWTSPIPDGSLAADTAAPGDAVSDVSMMGNGMPDISKSSCPVPDADVPDHGKGDETTAASDMSSGNKPHGADEVQNTDNSENNGMTHSSKKALASDEIHAGNPIQETDKLQGSDKTHKPDEIYSPDEVHKPDALHTPNEVHDADEMHVLDQMHGSCEIHGPVEIHGKETKNSNELYEAKNQAYAVNPSAYIIKGRALGFVSNTQDPFHRGIAIIQACVRAENSDKKDNILYYSVHKDTVMQIHSVLPGSLKVERIAEINSGKLVIQGMGTILHRERCKPDVCDSGSFTITIHYSGNEFTADSLHVSVKAGKNPAFNHDSGKIKLDGPDFTIVTL